MEKRYVSASASLLSQGLIKSAICTTSRSRQDQKSSTTWTSIDTASLMTCRPIQPLFFPNGLC